jgi:hypothetical protein
MSFSQGGSTVSNVDSVLLDLGPPGLVDGGLLGSNPVAVPPCDSLSSGNLGFGLIV